MYYYREPSRAKNYKKILLLKNIVRNVRYKKNNITEKTL